MRSAEGIGLRLGALRGLHRAATTTVRSEAMMVRVVVKQWSKGAGRWFTVEDCGPYEPDNMRNGAPKTVDAWLTFAQKMVMIEGCGGSELTPGERHLLTIHEFGPNTRVAETEFDVDVFGNWDRREAIVE